MSDQEGFFDGLLIGAIAGAMIGILTAPEKGEELRRGLYQAFEELGELFTEEINKSRTGM